MNNIKVVLIMMMAVFITSCDKDDEPDLVPPSMAETVKPNVGGSEQGNQVYLDLGTRTMTEKQRDSWDLAFYCGSDFRVIMNSSLGALSQTTSSHVLAAISGTDTAGMENMLSLDAIFANMISPSPEEWLEDAYLWADAPNGDLSSTAIAEISPTASDNNVYILNSGKNSDASQRPWYKMKVDQNGSGYDLYFADFNGGAEQHVPINKDANYNYIYYSFENGFVDVAPKRSDWDVAFTTYTDYVFIGYNVPYFYLDFVIQNRAGVEVYEYVIGDEDILLDEYNDLGLAQAQAGSFTYSANVNTIGANWRTVATPTPGSVTGVKTDRFYIVKDTEGEYYKVLFSQMLSDLGERGYPEILVEKLD